MLAPLSVTYHVIIYPQCKRAVLTEESWVALPTIPLYMNFDSCVNELPLLLLKQKFTDEFCCPQSGSTDKVVNRKCYIHFGPVRIQMRISL